MIQKTAKYLFYFLLVSLFWQTRVGFFKNQVVDYLIPFVYLSDILIVLILGALVLRKDNAFLLFARQPRFTRIHVVFAVFIALAVLTEVFTPFSLAGDYKLVKLVLFYGFAFAVAYFASLGQSGNGGKKLDKSVFGFEKVFFVVTAGLILESLLALGEWIRQASLDFQVLGEWRFSILTPGIAKIWLGGKEFLRPYATFPHPNILGGVTAITAAVCLYFVFSARSWKIQKGKKVYYTFCFLLFSWIALLTFSRSAWLGFLILVGGLVVHWFWAMKGPGKARQVFWFSVLVFLIGLSLTPIAWPRIKSLQTTDQLSVERRWQLNLTALQMFKEHPLLGVGSNQFVSNLGKYTLIAGTGRFLQPVHNVYLLVLSEHGTFGALTFLVFVLLVLKGIFVWPKDYPGQLPKTLLWIGVFIIALFDHYWWTLQAGQLFFWLTVGLSLSQPGLTIKSKLG